MDHFLIVLTVILVMSAALPGGSIDMDRGEIPRNRKGEEKKKNEERIQIEKRK